jgi:tetratricopeptide (TPR) repeat protein
MELSPDPAPEVDKGKFEDGRTQTSDSASGRVLSLSLGNATENLHGDEACAHKYQLGDTTTRPRAEDGGEDAVQTGCGTPASTCLSSIEVSRREPFTLNSPRSIEACARHSVSVEQLNYRPLEAFLQEAEEKGFIASVGHGRYESSEQKRRTKLQEVKREYLAICISRWKDLVERVLADVKTAVDQYMHFKTGVYHPDVGVELKSAIVVEGRRYIRYPPAWARGSGPEPPDDQTIRHLHETLKAMIEHNGLLEPAEPEWKIMVEMGCTLRPEEFEVKKDSQPPPPTLGLEEMVQQLARVFPKTSETERFKAARQGIVLETATEWQPCDSPSLEDSQKSKWLDSTQIVAKALPFRAFLSSTRQDRREAPGHLLPVCSHCGARCQDQPAHECPRCLSRSYCCPQCRQRDWDAGHDRNCLELQPVERQAGKLARTWLETCVQNDNSTTNPFVDAQPPPARFHSIEIELTTCYSAHDWQGVLRWEKEALAAASSLQTHWPEQALGILSMLVECHKALGDYDTVLKLLQRCEELVTSGVNKEMEAKVLNDIAQVYHYTLKNVHKATQYSERSLCAWREAGNRLHEGKVLAALGQLNFVQQNFVDALKYNQQALTIAKETGDFSWISHVENEICQCDRRIAAAVDSYEKAQEIGLIQGKRLRRSLVDLRKRQMSAQSLNPALSDCQVSSSHRADSLAMTRRFGIKPKRPQTSSSLSSFSSTSRRETTSTSRGSVQAHEITAGAGHACFATEMQTNYTPRVCVISKLERPRTSGFPQYFHLSSGIHTAQRRTSVGKPVQSPGRRSYHILRAERTTQREELNQTHDSLRPDTAKHADVKTRDTLERRPRASHVPHTRIAHMHSSSEHAQTAKFALMSPIPFLLRSTQHGEQQSMVELPDDATRFDLITAAAQKCSDRLTTATDAYGRKVPGWLSQVCIQHILPQNHNM